MERIMTQEERIKRAEEIYQRRKNQGVRLTSNTVNLNSRSDTLPFRNLIIKIIICAMIYLSFYIIKNSNYIFSQDILKKTNEVLSYDMNYKVIIAKVQEYYNRINLNLIKFNENHEINENTENNEMQEKNNDVNDLNKLEQNNDNNKEQKDDTMDEQNKNEQESIKKENNRKRRK